MEPIICTLSTSICEVLIWKEGPGQSRGIARYPRVGWAFVCQLSKANGQRRGRVLWTAQALAPPQPLPFPGPRRSKCPPRKSCTVLTRPPPRPPPSPCKSPGGPTAHSASDLGQNPSTPHFLSQSPPFLLMPHSTPPVCTPKSHPSPCFPSPPQPPTALDTSPLTQHAQVHTHRCILTPSKSPEGVASRRGKPLPG